MTPSNRVRDGRAERAFAAVLLAALLVRRTRLTIATPLAILADHLPLLGTPLPVALGLAAARGDAPLSAALAALGAWWLGLYGRRLSPLLRGQGIDARACTVLTINALRGARNAERLATLV